MSSLKSGSSPSALSRAAANSSSTCRVHTRAESGAVLEEAALGRHWPVVHAPLPLQLLFWQTRAVVEQSQREVGMPRAQHLAQAGRSVFHQP